MGTRAKAPVVIAERESGIAVVVIFCHSRKLRLGDTGESDFDGVARLEPHRHVGFAAIAVESHALNAVETVLSRLPRENRPLGRLAASLEDVGVRCQSLHVEHVGDRVLEAPLLPLALVNGQSEGRCRLHPCRINEDTEQNEDGD